MKCWLVNTGWFGGKATQDGIERMPIKETRALLNAALDGSLNDVQFRQTMDQHIGNMNHTWFKTGPRYTAQLHYTF